jgi:16S rRNA (guanine527-N7)-methyltransferase
MSDLDDTLIARELRHYGVSPDAALCEKIRVYTSLLLKWNRTISLTTVTDPIGILRFHFGESFFAASAVPIAHGRLADVGSGAGFPGLALRLLLPELDVTLIESNVKKSAFLSEAVSSLDLDRVTVFRGRMDELPESSRRFEFITARALGHFDELLSWAQPRLAAAGALVLWVGEEDAANVSRASGWSWRKPIRIPRSERRTLLIGSPKR